VSCSGCVRYLGNLENEGATASTMPVITRPVRMVWRGHMHMACGGKAEGAACVCTNDVCVAGTHLDARVHGSVPHSLVALQGPMYVCRYLYKCTHSSHAAVLTLLISMSANIAGVGVQAAATS
jgi:hypothetical protein